MRHTLKRIGLQRIGALVVGAAIALSPLPRAGAKSDEPRPPIWQVETTRGQIYLLGSVHLMKRGGGWMNQTLERAYLNADEVVLELDLDDLPPATMAAKIQAAARYAANEGGLETRISPKTRERFLKAASEAGLDGRVLYAFKPWFVALVLATQAQQARGYDENLGIDRTFLVRAAADGKPVAGLETIEDQIAALSVTAGETEDEALNEILDDLARAAQLTEAIQQAWRSGDLVKLKALIDEELADEPEAYDALLKKRNAAWTERLIDRLGKKRTALVVVGAAHLVGPDSVVEMLKRKGYRVTRK